MLFVPCHNVPIGSLQMLRSLKPAPCTAFHWNFYYLQYVFFILVIYLNIFSFLHLFRRKMKVYRYIYGSGFILQE